jgi:tetratricopeptide (TPR) repeat protein
VATTTAPEYFDLGTYSRATSAATAEAQTWFDRGLAWAYAFNHEEALRCFEHAAGADPEFALAHWGIAYAVGPNYNKAWEMFDEQDLAESLRTAHDGIRSARELAAAAAPVEAALIEALAVRFQSPDPTGPLDAWNAAYADAMGDVHRRHPEDPDVAALYADALMNLTAWQLWDLSTGRPAEGARTLEARAVLETAMARPGGMRHPGLLHLYVHLIEMSPEPEDALAAADALRDLVPDGGHLVHMPTHIDVLCGDYDRVVSGNDRAAAADERYAAHAGTVNFYSLYRAHNVHFKAYGAMFAGRRRDALEAADALEAVVPEELLRTEVPPMADWLEGFVPVRLHVMVRFGMWQELIDTPLPDDRELYCTTTALTHYARGVALAATGRVDEALAEREHFREAVTRVPDSRMLFNNTCADILVVASRMLDGELAYRQGEHEAAYAHLRAAIAADDGLPYDEPWGWMQPVRHAYGALLLEQGHLEEACAVYEADLGLDGSLARACQHPGNVWSLHGYHECLQRMGETRAARVVAQQLKRAAARADVPITASCFCRIEHHCC